MNETAAFYRFAEDGFDITGWAYGAHLEDTAYDAAATISRRWFGKRTLDQFDFTLELDTGRIVKFHAWESELGWNVEKSA